MAVILAIASIGGGWVSSSTIVSSQTRSDTVSDEYEQCRMNSWSRSRATRKYSSAVRDEQAARTRARILDAASELFLERGYARTTMKDIADSRRRRARHRPRGLRQQGTGADRAHRPSPGARRHGRQHHATTRCPGHQGRGRPTQADRAVRDVHRRHLDTSCGRSSRSCAPPRRSSPRWRTCSRRWIASA